MDNGAHPQARRLRWALVLAPVGAFISGVLLETVASPWWDDDLKFRLLLALTGLVGGIVHRSWWAVPLLPVALYAGSRVGLVLYCQHREGACAPWSATPLINYVRYTLPALGTVALSAALGVYLSLRLRPRAGR